MNRTRALVSVLGLGSFALVTGCADESSTATADEQNLLSGPPLQFSSYEVLFTNPVCETYNYDQPVYAENGELLTQKPQDVYCTHNDSGKSGARPESPQYRLLEWINDPETKEIFFTYLSFSNSTVLNAMCSAIQERDVKVTFVIDSSSDTTKADRLRDCHPGSGNPELEPRFEKRGHTPGIGYAHNKLFMVNPGAETMKLAFSSGNMSSGVVLHHENWHFITLPSNQYFPQSHLCLMQAELDHASSKTEYRNFLDDCLGAIEYKPESDIRGYFVPADHGTASKALLSAIREAESIDMAAHRFSYTKMVSALKSSLDQHDTPMRLIADDDMYWAGKGQKVGDNMSFEYYNTVSLTNRGAEVRWMETNHDMHLLHHNKFLIFDMPEGEPDAVWCGAGNLTGTGFTTNWENYYYVTIPEVVEAYKVQYEHMWNDLATPPERMPTENILPQ